MHSSPSLSPGAGRRPPPAPGGRGGGLLVFLLLAGTAFGIGAYLPAISCPRCGHAYRERLRYSTLPGVTRQQAAALLDLAESDVCGTCWHGRRTLVTFWLVRNACGG